MIRSKMQMTRRSKRSCSLSKFRSNGPWKFTYVFRQDFLLIKARNEDVTKKLQSAYAAKVKGGSLSVFCVSNRHYKKFSEKGNTEYVIASGIPALRHFCHSIAAKAQHREARHFLDTSLPSLLSSMQLWVESFRERSESSWQELQEKLETGAETAISQVSFGMRNGSLLYYSF